MRERLCCRVLRIVGLTLAAAACAGRAERAAIITRSAGGPDPGAAGTLVIEQFLRAANTKDYGTMSRLFGTKQGPIVDLYDRRQVDQRMVVLATLLEHEDYAVRSVALVPGRSDGARQLIVRMKVRGRETDVPYTLVPNAAGGWLIEQIDLERITGR